MMLEAGGVLETYRVDVPPEELGPKPVEVEKIFDHPLKFLSYEGSVNKGKGSVEIADWGKYEVLSKREGRIRFKGMVIKGEFTLMRIDGARWEIGKQKSKKRK